MTDRSAPRATKSPTRALDRGLAILEAVAQRPNQTLAQLAEACDLSPATALRILDTLCARDFVSRNEAERSYRIGLRSFEVGSRFLSETRLQETCGMFLHRLTAETAQTATLAILEKGEVVYIDVREGTGALRSSLRVGERAPAHASASGKAMLAWQWEAGLAKILGDPPYPRLTDNTITDADGFRAALADVRRAGFAIDREEHRPDLTCIAAPIRSRAGQVIAAFGIQGLSGQMAGQAGELSQALLVAAEEASQRLGWRPGSRGSPNDSLLID